MCIWVTQSNCGPITMYKRIGIIGMGVMGGSLAARIAQQYPDTERYGVDPDPETRQYACDRGWVSQAVSEIADLPTDLDLAIVCTPIAQVRAAVLAVSDHSQGPVVLSDIASVKAPLMGLSVKANQTYIGGHPMMGSEKMGVAHAAPQILDGGQYVVVPQVPDSPEVPIFMQWIAGMAMQPILMEAQDHDNGVAVTSHIPYLMACLTIRATHGYAVDPVVGPGLRDTTRVAAHDPAWGVDVCRENTAAIATGLQGIRDELDHVLTMLKTDPDQVLNWLSAAKHRRDALFNTLPTPGH
jgi:prephenate dehydrogenase